MHLFAHITLLFILLAGQGPAGSPVIEAGREAEIEALFSQVGKVDSRGWSVPDISIPSDRIRAFMEGPADSRLVLDLCYPEGNNKAVAKTPSFEFFVVEYDGIDGDRAREVARLVAVAVGEKDTGTFWRKTAGPGGGNLTDGTRWFSTVGGLSTITWMALFWGLLAIITGSVIRRKPWQRDEARGALIEMTVLFVIALLLRHIVMHTGPGQMVARLPDPAAPPGAYPQFGCGFGGWILSWFLLLGTDDSTAFFAGSLAGALTVIPVYMLAWLGSGSARRWAGLVAGVLITLWPIHARISPTDDAGGLIALLIVGALALMIAAERYVSRLYLVAGWLTGCLAATTRPEAALALVPLGIVVLLGEQTRRMQFRINVLLPSLALGAVCGTAVYLAGSEALSGGFSPLVCATNAEARGLFDLGGRSILGPPRTPWPLTVFFCMGLAVTIWSTRGRSLAWLAAALLPCLPTACFARTDIVTARYQLALVPVAAVLAGIGFSWLASKVHAWLPRAGCWIVAAAACLPLVAMAVPLLEPPPEPTFKLEYKFFREHLEEIPAGCRIVHISWNYGDIGLRVPTYLSGLLDLGHIWVKPSADLDTERGCLVYWQPASCRADSPSFGSERKFDIMPECRLIETSYRLEPVAVTRLPARPEFCDEYSVDPVPVGFYRLRPLESEQPRVPDTTDDEVPAGKVLDEATGLTEEASSDELPDASPDAASR